MWRRLARYEHAEEWRILHAQDAQKLYIHGTEKRRGLLLLLEFVVVVVGEGDSCVKKEESAQAELHRRGTVQ
jgi:hypothetical protein